MADFRPRFPRGRLATRGCLARRPPRRRPSALAPLGPFDPSATGARPFVLSSFRPVVDRPQMGELFPRNPANRQKDIRTPGQQSPAPRSFGDRGATFCPIVVSSCRRPAAEGGRLSPPGERPRTTRRRDDTTTGSPLASIRCAGESFSSTRQPVVLAERRARSSIIIHRSHQFQKGNNQ